MRSSIKTLVILALFALAAPHARAEDEPFHGTFKLFGKEGWRAISGQVVIRGGADAPVFVGPLGSKGPVTLIGRRDGAGWSFTPAPAGGSDGGIAGALARPATETAPDAPPAYTLRLAPSGKPAKPFTGTVVSAEGRTLMTVELVRRKRALICHSIGNEQSHDNVFLVYARQIKTYFRALGYEVDVVPAQDWPTIFGALRAAGTSGATYTRVVTIGHGGWDGPIFQGQKSPWNGGSGWSELVAALRAGTTADAKYWVSACHAAGSDRHERSEESPWRPRDRWVDQVARAAGRICAGPAGITSTTLALRQVRAFEGAGSTAQESRLASPEGVRVVRSGGLIVNARLTPWADVDAADAAALAAASTN